MKGLKDWNKWLVLFLAFVLLVLTPVSVKAAPGKGGTHSSRQNRGWKVVNNKIYYYGRNGRKAVGWVRIQGTPYCFRKSGALKKGWLNFRGRHYYYGRYGDCHTGWFIKANQKYYCDPQKGRLYGWNQIGGRWYYFRKSGSVTVNKWIPNQDSMWYVNASGKVTKRVPKNDTVQGYDTILMVGGSRFRHMGIKYKITADNVRYIARGGAKVNWLMDEAYPQIQKAVVKGKKTAIVFNLGLNDMSHVDVYLRFYNEQMSYFLDDPDCDLYMMSVNPIDEKKYSQNKRGGNKHNQNIYEFNQKMRSQLDARWNYIDTCQYLTGHFNMEELTVWDGIHYNREGSQLVFRYCMNFLRKD